MTQQILLSFIIAPFLAGLLVLLISDKLSGLRNLLFVAAALANLYAAWRFLGRSDAFSAPWGGFGFRFALRVYPFSSYIILSAAGLGALVALYCTAFMQGRPAVRQFYCYFLAMLGFVNGAALADDLLVLLLFWEGMSLALFGMILVGGAGSFRTAIKALIIGGVADLCMMIGVALTVRLAQTGQISAIHLPLDGAGSAAFLLLMIGALAKGGAMPFHSWIPDAADDAPLPFMALVPAALEKLIGIYFLARISLDLFAMHHGSWVSTVLMTIGALTILLAVLMALVQKDYKRLLSFHAISQVGYMVLGIGTGTPAGIVGGLFHMINNALYKCGLFLTGGAVEKQAGTSDLRKLGGLGRQMPLTCLGFIIAALSISGVPPFNGFFSKELVYEGALERGVIFYAAAVIGSFLTAASFLKLGHAAFFGKAPNGLKAKEAPLAMLIPILLIAGVCVLFGVYNELPIGVIEKVLGQARLGGHHFAGMPEDDFLILMTVVVLLLALFNHLWGAKYNGSGLAAVDHIHYAPLLHGMYDRAERRVFDPYEVALRGVQVLAQAVWKIDRGVDWVYDVAVPSLTEAAAGWISRRHTGSYTRYLTWSLLGTAAVVMFIVYG
jgi:formate hydrogenlyase subunit 3/multisubunit Na+/H+ antiporter MnhD subunit